MSRDAKVIPIYTSKGDAELFMVYPYLFNRLGEWVGWTSQTKDIFSILGVYVGYFSKDHRILRNRFTSELKPNIIPPEPPTMRVLPPSTIPLAPLMSELLYSTLDVLLEEPERLHTSDSGELRPDLD